MSSQQDWGNSIDEAFHFGNVVVSLTKKGHQGGSTCGKTSYPDVELQEEARHLVGACWLFSNALALFFVLIGKVDIHVLISIRCTCLQDVKFNGRNTIPKIASGHCWLEGTNIDYRPFCTNEWTNEWTNGDCLRSLSLNLGNL